MVSFSFNLPPETNIEVLKAKKPELHFDYDEIIHEAHLKAFTIAKVTKLDLLSEIQNSLIQAQSEGKSFEVWKKDITPMLAKKGWLGKVEVINKKTGEIKRINVNNTRLKRIYNTNMRTANAQGRAKAQYALEGEIYLRYIALQDGLTRPNHLRMHGITLHRDDPFWEKNYPPNGWNCRCVVRAYSKSECERQGFEISNTPPLPIADKDWSYDKRGLNKDESLDSFLESKIERFGKESTKSAFVESLKETQENCKQAEKNYKNIKALQEGKLEKITLAKLPQKIMQKLRTKTDELLLSHTTLQGHLQRHPEVNLLDYSLMPFLLQDANIIDIQETKEHHILLFSRFGKHYRAAIKTTKDKNENYLLSLVKRSSEFK
ncbi:phage minor head protein [Helicobacter sp. UBA3407]|nr:phage minor head protein [Helicobacter sp. UBA3407]